MQNALSEITLVLFTTLAPSGVLAMIALSFPLVGPSLAAGERVQLNRLVGVPVAVALVGLIASATHLGNPANALYVLTGAGRSPLSDEVLAAVVYFGFAGIYWFGSFSERPCGPLGKAWLVLADVAGALFVASIAFAYRAETIISWDTPFVPLNLCLNAFVGGPLLAVAVLVGAERALHAPDRFAGLRRMLVMVSAGALVLNMAGYALQGGELAHLGNSVSTALDQAPCYFAGLALFCVLAGLGIACDVRFSLRGPCPHGMACSIVACLLALCGIFVMRFLFYMSYLTVGLGV